MKYIKLALFLTAVLSQSAFADWATIKPRPQDSHRYPDQMESFTLSVADNTLVMTSDERGVSHFNMNESGNISFLDKDGGRPDLGRYDSISIAKNFSVDLQQRRFKYVMIATDLDPIDYRPGLYYPDLQEIILGDTFTSQNNAGQDRVSINSNGGFIDIHDGIGDGRAIYASTGHLSLVGYKKPDGYTISIPRVDTFNLNQINNDSRIQGETPHVAIDDCNNVVIVYESYGNLYNIRYKISPTDWKLTQMSSDEYDSGQLPRIDLYCDMAAQKSYYVETHLAKGAPYNNPVWTLYGELSNDGSSVSRPIYKGADEASFAGQDAVPSFIDLNSFTLGVRSSDNDGHYFARTQQYSIIRN